jgi:hypothetical protein
MALQKLTPRTQLGAGSVVQVVSVFDGEAVTTGSTIAHDDTIPQSSEGVEVMTLAITPNSASNILRVDVVVSLTHGTVEDAQLTANLFRDSATDAAATQTSSTGPNSQTSIAFSHIVTAGSTAPTTFKVRIGAGNAGTVTFNGSGGTRKFGGVLASSIIITEIAA